MAITEFESRANIDYPVGAVIPWNDSALSSIPPGWAYCDGANGTPDLRDTHPRSVPNTSTDPGATGGTNSQTLAEANLPSHSHSASSFDTTGSHTHKATSGGSAPDDSHSIDDFSDTSSNWSLRSGGGHSHSLNTSTTGSSSSYDNQPANKTAHFIKRIS